MEKAVTCKGPDILVHGSFNECVAVYPTRVCGSMYCKFLPCFTLLWTIDVPIGLPIYRYCTSVPFWTFDVPIGLPVPATLRFPPCN